MTLRTARKELRNAVQNVPRLGVHIHQELVDGKRKRSAPYVVNIFDRSPAWIKPRYQIAFTGDCGYITLQALAWINDHIEDIEAMADKVERASINPAPFTADVPTLKNGCAA